MDEWLKRRWAGAEADAYRMADRPADARGCRARRSAKTVTSFAPGARAKNVVHVPSPGSWRRPAGKRRARNWSRCSESLVDRGTPRRHRVAASLELPEGMQAVERPSRARSSFSSQKVGRSCTRRVTAFKERRRKRPSTPLCTPIATHSSNSSTSVSSSTARGALLGPPSTCKKSQLVTPPNLAVASIVRCFCSVFPGAARIICALSSASAQTRHREDLRLTSTQPSRRMRSASPRQWPSVLLGEQPDARVPREPKRRLQAARVSLAPSLAARP